MSGNSNGSSVDPDDVQATLRDANGAVSCNSSQRDSAVSLSAMSDLDYDATPMSPPYTSHSQPEYTLPNTGTSPQGNLQQLSGTPYVSSTGQPLQGWDAHGLAGAPAIPVPASVSQTDFNVESSGPGYKPQVEEAVPDNTYSMPSIPKDPSKDSLESLCRKTKQEPYDAVIISHPHDWAAVQELKQRLNDILLFDGKHARVAVEDDDANLGKGEISYFEQWLQKAEVMFLYTSKNFCQELNSIFKMEVAIVESFFVEHGKKEFVIPIFLENKYKCKYISPSVRAIKGIDFIGCEWSERIAKKFKINLDAARKGRKNRELEQEMADVNSKLKTMFS